MRQSGDREGAGMGAAGRFFAAIGRFFWQAESASDAAGALMAVEQ